jgi:hypothetical protein
MKQANAATLIRIGYCANARVVAILARMGWAAGVGVACTLLVFGACSSSESHQTSAGTASDASALAQASDHPSPNAPDWCARLLSDNVLTLPSALTLLGDPDRGAAAEAVVRGAAADLGDVIADVPPAVGAATGDVVDGLQLVATGPSDAEAFDVLAKSLSEMERVTQSTCEYSP